MAWFTKTGLGLLVAFFAAGFAATYVATVLHRQSLISDVARNVGQHEILDQRKFPPPSVLAITRSGNTLTLPRTVAQPTAAIGTQMLVLSQGGYISKRLLGCWHGTTANQPSEWRRLSPLAALQAYHRDNINVCFTWKSDKLEVTDSQWSCAGCNYGRNHRRTYQVVSATGDHVELKVEDSAGALSNKGLEVLTLHQDDTVDDRISFTAYLMKRRTIRAATTAQLRRNSD